MTGLSEAVHAVVELQGAVAGALVDLESGNCLARAGREETFNLSLIGAINAQVLRAEMRMVQDQFPLENIEDLMITLGKHYHLIRLVQASDTCPCLFLYVVLARDTANLVLARRKMAEVATKIVQAQETLHQVERAQFAALLRNPSPVGILGFHDKLDTIEEEDEEELPPFMREETVMKLLGTMEASYGLTMVA